MSAFFDCKGRDWTLRLTVGVLADVRTHAGIDLGKAIRSEQSLSDLLFGDPSDLVKVLWVLVSKKAEERQVTPEEFAHGFDGPALEQATEALLQAIADFFPRSRVAAALKTGLAAALEKMDRTVLSQMGQMAQASNNSAGNSPASADSTHAP